MQEQPSPFMNTLAREAVAPFADRMQLVNHAPPERHAERWMARSVAFGAGAGADLASTAAAGRLMTERLPLLTPHSKEELPRASGLAAVELFYAALSFRVWVATAR